MISVALDISARGMRVVLSATNVPEDKPFTMFTTVFGLIYSAANALSILSTLAYYIKSTSALRRLSISEYYVHPDRAYQAQERYGQ